MIGKQQKTEELHRKALECGTKGELRLKYPSIRIIARKLGIWEKITSHMPKSVSFGKTPYNKKWYSIEDILPFSLQCTTRTEFYERFPHAYQGAKELRILDLVCAHMPKDASVGKTPHNKKWTEISITKEALEYTNRTDFARQSSGAYNAAIVLRILDKVCKHMTPIKFLGENHPNFKWTDEMLKQEALKYKTKNEFRDSNPRAYDRILDRGLIDQFCSHMPKYVCGEDSPQFKWTLEKLQEEALKHESRGEFQEKGEGAYQTALNRRILDKICSHMKLSRNISLPESSLLNTIKIVYPKAQTLRDRKVKIENKPYIQGFHIDIYVPELRKGIEFDGKYWHSFEGMKSQKGKENWPDEDIKNYHNLKDQWFLSKGIQILHIKEEDWNKNRQACIDQCLEFLGR